MIIDRFIAIDNVCSWPNLTMMPNGSIIATIFNQPTHGGWEGDVECWYSEDKGRSWILQGIPAPHEPSTNRMNVAAGLANNGNLLVLASGWSKRNPIGNYSSPHDGEILPIWVCCSEDMGKSWTHAEIEVIGAEKPNKIIPFGDIVQLPDKNLGACLYGAEGNGVFSAYFYVSRDDGQTWSKQGCIGESNYNETAPLLLDDGRLLCASRTGNPQHLELFESEDQGKSWAASSALTLGSQHPGHLLRLNDGAILLTYGIRNKGLYGLGARISRDQGKTWEAPIVLLDFETATDGGYPASVQFEDDMIVTAYYCNQTPAHQRYHTGVIRWKIE